ncbi:DUF2946 family protein [Achromobacter xylosoxidans]|uniref:DUF2946 domain-containing protein n=1 Tax=Alcaligenes xylosoxydans xylosoxydans TaxID=85698 RepID=A0A0X8NVN7_ALCXX|nr:DUF2946 family protein [Achromobacter xylosoxidans]AMG35222.1 DUF2946 domain-containing protein [Achromobacter xylosoxidans]
MAISPRPGPPLALKSWHAHCVLWALLLALVLRGFVPPGYMPDTRALENGRVTLTLCSAAGTVSTVLLSLTDERKESARHGEQAASGMDCPYGLLAHDVSAQPLPALAPLPLRVTVAALPAVHPRQALPPLPALGPPLGSRAPPLSLG